MVALYTAYLPRSSPRDESLSNKASSLNWRWYLVMHVIISIGDDSVYNGVSALGDVTKTRNHLHSDDTVYLRVVISRDDGTIFKVSSPEMTASKTRYHLWPRRIVSPKVQQRLYLVLEAVISGDDTLKIAPSSLEMITEIIHRHLRPMRIVGPLV